LRIEVKARLWEKTAKKGQRDNLAHSRDGAKVDKKIGGTLPKVRDAKIKAIQFWRKGLRSQVSMCIELFLRREREGLGNE